ncbi:MAG: aminoacetone oxidase family FAD-binding enzyme [Prevotella sp.]|nr:aminoacetone oxidase family FAD-binding enzyme [Prevotella sp.]MBQ8629157.1 aminoacetone oxidase family FAD-binding enzyme [Prevotella sp.]
MRVAIIGAGAAGCFASIVLKRIMPTAVVDIYEGGVRPLAKVSVTGGGRCNLTNSFNKVRSIAEVYPRGERIMKRLLREFSNNDACRWFEAAGVKLLTQEDECVFPVSQDAMEIVNCLLGLIRKHGISLHTRHKVMSISHLTYVDESHDALRCDEECPSVGRGFYRISFADAMQKTVEADVVVVTTGGSQRSDSLQFVGPLSLDIVPPVPSLFSFCLSDKSVREMTGTVVENASVSLAGTKLRSHGALLITHWGMSGPAVLKLSSYAARHLSDTGYKGTLLVNWLGDSSEQEAMQMLADMAQDNPQKMLCSVYPQQLNSRLWTYLLLKSGLNSSMRWGELGRKGYNKLVNTLTNDQYEVTGKNRFKEEFVTCGGISLTNVSSKTLECKSHEGLYFAGEVLDIDGITGGFNLQAAWSMAHTVAYGIARKYGDK